MAQAKVMVTVCVLLLSEIMSPTVSSYSNYDPVSLGKIDLVRTYDVAFFLNYYSLFESMTFVCTSSICKEVYLEISTCYHLEGHML